MRNTQVMFQAIAVLAFGAVCSNAADWSPWIRLPDGHDDRVSYRTLTGTFAYEGDTRKLSWQLRNDYASRVRFEYTVCYSDKGRRQCNDSDMTLNPGATSLTGGTWDIGDPKSGLEIRMKSIAVETPSVIEFPGKKKQGGEQP